MGKIDVDMTIAQVGSRSRYQVMVYFIVAVAYNWTAVWQLFSFAFAGAFPLDFHCRIPDGSSKNQTIPLKPGPRGNLVYSQCEMYVNNTFRNETMPCADGYTYTTDFKASFVTEWSLYCDREVIVSTSHTMMIVGALVSAILLNPLADTYGRKPVFLICQWLMAIVGFSMAFCPNWQVYYALNFFRGLFGLSVMTNGIVITGELFPTETRVFFGNLIQIFWCTGMVTLAGWAALFPDWRHLHMAISAPSILTVPFIWLMPESLTWLLSTDRLEKAEEVIKKACKFNGVDEPKKMFIMERENPNFEMPAMDTDLHETGSVLDLFRFPKMRKYTLIMFFEWFASQAVYWGLSLGSASMDGNRYVNFVIQGLVELPAVATCLFFVPRVGRRVVLSGANFLGGACLIVTTFLPTTVGGVDMTVVQITMSFIGKFFITNAFLDLMFYTPEMFPTSHRNVGMGVGFMIGLAASIIASFLPLLGRSVWQYLPGIVLISLATLAGFAALFLAETVGRPLPDTIEQVERWTLQPSAKEKEEYRRMSMRPSFSTYDSDDVNMTINTAEEARHHAVIDDIHKIAMKYADKGIPNDGYDNTEM